jgi:deazaflavin-dependent oxidoreductase (nitroreductase family)
LNSQTIAEFRAKGGAPTHPHWYHNLVVHPEVTLEVGPETYQAMATVITGEERDRLYARQAELYPQFADYQRRTSRKIPVIALERKRG